MPVSITTARLSGIAMFAATGATALSLAACGSSNDSKPNSAGPPSTTATSSPTPSAKGEGHDWLSGLIDSVSGSTVAVSAKSGSATVDFTPSTAVFELSAAQLSDVTAGSCVSVQPDRHSNSPAGSSVTARAIRISTAVDGTCPQGKQRSGAPTAHPQATGQVASVAGNTITVNSVAPAGNSAPTTVTVTASTTYTKKAAVDAQAITHGKCILAHGSKEGSALQATAITVQPADNGTCPEPGEHQRH